MPRIPDVLERKGYLFCNRIRNVATIPKRDRPFDNQQNPWQFDNLVESFQLFVRSSLETCGKQPLINFCLAALRSARNTTSLFERAILRVRDGVCGS